ncbi:MAG: hypothetical protein Q8P87_01005 [bacterium]|nr:hypothetical protein [bacterium]
MAIIQTKKQSDLEKRLLLLRKQVYGKEFKVQSENTTNYQSASKQVQLPTTNSSTDLTYFHQDLLKILLLSSFAIGTQVILFFLLKNHILKINFF